MPHLLRIDSSALHQGSFSKKLADHFQRTWTQVHHQGSITHHDLIDFEIPHIDERFIDAAYTHKEKRSAEQSRNLALSDRLVEELRETDTLLLSTPMYNFAIPSQLKAYLDHITRVGETFQYTENGPNPNISQICADLACPLIPQEIFCQSVVIKDTTLLRKFPCENNFLRNLSTNS